MDAACKIEVPSGTSTFLPLMVTVAFLALAANFSASIAVVGTGVGVCEVV